MSSVPKLYDQLASWWPLLSQPSDYVEEAATYRRALLDYGYAPADTLLELGSGGGNNASHLKDSFTLTLVDPAPGMLAVSRTLNPECEHILADMRSVRLQRQFDRVFVHDAICYMTTLADLRSAVATAYAHCRHGGAAVFAPDFVRETFRTGTDDGGHDDGQNRGLRYLAWTWDPDPTDTTYTVDYAYMLKDADGVRVEQDQHIEGLFTRSEWLSLLEDVGFTTHNFTFEHSEEPAPLELFIGVRE